MHKKILLSVIWLLLATAAIAIAADSEGIHWRSYEEGMDLAEKQGKKVYLHFYADWCGYCRQMEQTTFRASEVLYYLNKNFIPIRVDTEKDSVLARRYNVRPIPDNWFLEESGDRIANRPGFIPPEDMYLLLKYFNTESYKRITFREFVDKER